MICETELPPEANVEPHSHQEAETFYILDGEFTFYLEDMNKPIKCEKGAFICTPPFTGHAVKNESQQLGKILGMIIPAGATVLDNLFRIMGVSLSEDDKVPYLNQPVERLLEEIKRLKK